MNVETLREGYKRILQYIYLPEHYYARIRTLLKDYPSPTIKTRVGMGDIRAFLRSVFHLGMKGKERVHYWRLLFWTLFHRPKLFPLAITLAVYGFHFRRVCEVAAG